MNIHNTTIDQLLKFIDLRTSLWIWIGIDDLTFIGYAYELFEPQYNELITNNIKEMYYQYDTLNILLED